MKLAILFLALLLMACAPPHDAVDPYQHMGRCDGAPIPTCVNGVAVGCSFDNIYSDKTSLQLWTTFDGSQTIQGVCHYGSDANSCPADVKCF